MVMMNTKNNNMPKVSVIVPIYGVEKYIERCARSLFEQTLDDIEFIFVDDCTPDRSIDILKSLIEKFRLRFAEKKYDVRIVRMPTNSGQAAVRRHGMQLATGDYIIHCDSDDWVEPEAYQKMFEMAEHNNTEVVICSYTRTDGFSTIKNKGLEFPKDNIVTSDYALKYLLQSKIPTSVWTKLVKAELYKDESLIYPVANMWEDYVYSVQIINKAKKIGLINEPLYNYFYNPVSICNTNIENRVCQMVQNCDVMLSYLFENTNYDANDSDIISLKLLSRSELQYLTHIHKYRDQWKRIYPEINKIVLYTNISFGTKIRFVLTYVGVYSYIYKIKNIILKQ